MNSFTVTVRTPSTTIQYIVQDWTSMAAYMTAANEQGDTPCGITVLSVEVSR